MELMPREPDGREQENTTPQRPGAVSYTHLDVYKRQAFDGDADRCLAVDEKGREIDGDKIIAILAKDLKDAGKLPEDTAVVTVMSNLGSVSYTHLWRLVTNLPSLPAKGLSLTAKVISTVGSLILTKGRGSTICVSHRVLPVSYTHLDVYKRQTRRRLR